MIADRRRHRRGELALIAGCRAGDSDALAALGYRLADVLWWASDGDDARAAAGMARVLRRLEAFSWPTVQELAALASAAAGKRGAAMSGEVEAPVEFADRLAAQATDAGATLAETGKRRVFWRAQAYAVVAALALSIIMILVSYGVLAHMQRQPSAMLVMLQFRIRHSGLAMELHDLAWDLPDPHGANRETAKTLADAALVLDEVANLRPAEASFSLGYIGERVRAGQLVWKVLGAAQDEPARSKDTLLDASLALEEIETWSPGGRR